MLKLIFFMEFQTLAEFLAQLYPKEAEIFRLKSVYIIFLGIPMAIVTLIQIIGCFCSVIGIPVAIVMAKSLGTLLQPVGKVCVDHSVAQALLVEQGRNQLQSMNNNR